MRSSHSFAGQGVYPEREDTPEPVMDRLLAGLGFRFHSVFSRRLAGQRDLAAEVRRHAARFRDGPLAPHVPQLRYRLRRDGFRLELVSECFGLYCAALSEHGADALPPEVLSAARLLVEGGIAELADPAGRLHALALAATATVMHGIPVHVVTSSDVRARRAAEALRAPLEKLDIGVGCVAQGMDPRAKRDAYSSLVVCGAHREIASDYLRDRLQIGARSGALLGMVGRLSGDAPAKDRLMLGGLRCALVDEADIVMLDDVHTPLVIATEADQSRERLMYEQALELARALADGADFTVDDEGASLTEEGTRLLARLIAPLGGIWAAPERREQLITIALDALHRCERDLDYRVEQGRVIFPRPSADDTAEVAEPDEILQKLVEVKEGCKLSGRRDVLARMSLPRFFRRYLHLAGVCADASGLEREFWALYSLKTTLAGLRPAPVKWSARVFSGVEAKRAALLETVRAEVAAGRAVVVALRSPPEAQAVVAALGEAGVKVGIVRGGQDETEQKVLASLDHPGSVAVTLYPAARNVTRGGASAAPLSLVVAELHDAQRHIAQIRRAFAAASCEILLSLEDEAVASRIGAITARAARLGASGRGELSARRARWLASVAQRGAERAHALMRQELMSRDQHFESLLAFSGRRE